MPYLDQAEYLEMGGTITEDDELRYQRLESRASHAIDRATHGRIKGEKPVRNAVKFCVYEMIERYASDEAMVGMSGREIASMSNDGVSVSYVSGASASGGSASALRDTESIRAWLLDEVDGNGTPLLYAGVDA